MNNHYNKVLFSIFTDLKNKYMNFMGKNTQNKDHLQNG
ncbi:hypothetical protein [Borreliella valaisiana]